VKPDAEKLNQFPLSNELINTLNEITRRLASIEIAVVSLDHVRRSLMAKYDETHTTAINRVKDLEAESKTLRTGLTVDIAKINQKLSKIQEELNEIKYQQDK
jgi:hypothetical protein